VRCGRGTLPGSSQDPFIASHDVFVPFPSRGETNHRIIQCALHRGVMDRRTRRIP
jgi:hypothetical protein